MKYREVEYAVKEINPGKWQWTIFPKKEQHGIVRRADFYASREEAEDACKKEIDKGLNQA